MTERAMPDTAPNPADLFEIIRTTRSMRRLKPDPVPERFDPQDPGGGRVCAERRKHAKVAVPRNQGRGDQADCRGVLQACMGRAGRTSVSVW
jgi:hypothetical protein